MNQKLSVKQSRLIAVLAGALIISIAVSVFFYSRQDGQDSAFLSQNLSAVPDHTAALSELFGIPDSGGKVRISANELSSIWFEQSFSLGNDEFHVIFTKTQEIDPQSGAIVKAHAQGVKVGAITYKRIDSQWQAVSKQPKFGDFGEWGDVPEVKQAEILQLSPENIAFMLDAGGGMGGFFESGKALFAYSKNSWRDLGYVQTDADNSGACDEAPSDEGGSMPCWRYTGTISIVPGENAEYPDLLITRTGTESGENGVSIVPAKNVTYVFNGEKYVDASKL
ncbi:hypothetical protein V2P20_16660 [Methylobacter sp. Wu1]|uniref:hypothetical protein n=1 Tax=Methylobacter sp. Wu1 TaxID=3119359 RepID=UPI002F952380